MHEINLNDADLMELGIETLHLLSCPFEFWRIVTISQNLISSVGDSVAGVKLTMLLL